MAEPIVIVLQTFKRTEYALKTIEAAHRHLKYPDLRWYIADDGSSAEHVHALWDRLNELEVYLVGFHSHRNFYGENCNLAYKTVSTVSTLGLWLEDDWELECDVDLYPYAELLMERPTIGMVRMGYLNPGLIGRTIEHNGRVYWELAREPFDPNQMSFAGHPSLRHNRFWEAYGPYPIIENPGETERMYGGNYRTREGPSIVWPHEWPTYGHFGHIGSVKTETML